MKATFFERLLSYILDFLFIGIIISLISINVPNQNDKYQKKLEQITTQFMNQDIKEPEYIKEYSNIIYENNKNNILINGVYLVIMIGYFIIFQYMNNGQTLGKKILKIKVVDKVTKKPTSLKNGIIRSMFIYNIASGIIGIICLYVMNKINYFICFGIISFIESLFILVTIFFVLYKKDGRGLHDMLANTIVIKEGR